MVESTPPNPPSDPSWGPLPPEQNPAPASGPVQTAAISVWVTAGVTAFLFGCCAMVFAALGFAPPDVFNQAMPPDAGAMGFTPATFRTIFRVLAVLVAVFLFLPALLLLYLGFRVRDGHRGGTIAALVVIVLQALIVACFILLYIIGAAASGQVLAVLPPLLILGATLALFGWTIWALTRALRTPDVGSPYDDEEPWNIHTPRGL